MTVGVEKLAGLAAGDTVRARYKTKNGIVEVCSKVVDDDSTNWFYLALPGHDRLGLRQTVTDSTHGDLVEVVSVVKPPYAEGADSHSPQLGDVVEGYEVLPEQGGRCRWFYRGDYEGDGFSWVKVDGYFFEGKKIYKPAELPEKLRLVQRLKDWPVRSDDANLFARAQRIIAQRIRLLHNYAGSYDRDTVLDEAAKVVECFDLDDAYPGED